MGFLTLDGLSHLWDKITAKIDDIKSGIVQSDWSVTDESSNAFIKNKPDIKIDYVADTKEQAQAAINSGLIDEGATIYVKEDSDTIVQTSNPNLLINPNFKINQRGGKIVKSGTVYYSDADLSTSAGTTTSVYVAGYVRNAVYSITTDSAKYYVNADDVIGGYADLGYTVDRWKLKNGYVIINSDKTITLNGTIQQVLEDAVGENIAVSVSAGSASYDNDIKTFTITTTEDTVISWAKLELGSVVTQFVPPDPATELIKCKRYYQIYNRLFGTFYNTNDFRTNIIFPVEMRTTTSPYIGISTINVIGRGNVSSSGYAARTYTTEMFGFDTRVVTPSFTINIGAPVQVVGRFILDAEL